MRQDWGTSIDLLIVAAGSGERMGGTDKALLHVAGAPSLHHILVAAAATPRIQRIIVVAAESRVATYATLPWLTDRVAAIVAGGATRAASVYSGLEALQRAPGVPAATVLIHDAARPGVSRELFERVANAADEHGAAVPSLRLVDTIKRVTTLEPLLIADTLDRSTLRAAQTPQGIAARHLAAFMERLDLGGAAASDDASIAEVIGIPVALVEGAERLRKITVAEDVRILNALLLPAAPELAGLEAEAVRIGWGEDAHPAGTAGELRLGGISFPGSPALVGHSDGDVVLHAVADALLGAAGLGDLGRHFPADARTPQGVASTLLVSEACTRATAVGVTPLRVDLLITAESPKLAPHLDEIGARVAALLGLPVGAVNAKASTGNLVNDEGRGAAIRCTALLVARGVAVSDAATSVGHRREGR